MGSHPAAASLYRSPHGKLGTWDGRAANSSLLRKREREGGRGERESVSHRGLELVEGAAAAVGQQKELHSHGQVKGCVTCAVGQRQPMNTCSARMGWAGMLAAWQSMFWS